MDTNPPIFGNINYDLMDQLLDEGCWLQTADHGSTFLQPDPSTSLNLRYHDPLPTLEGGFSSYQQETETRNSTQNESQPQDQKSITPAVLKSFSWGSDELNRILWIAPKSSNSTPVKERLMNAICHLREINKNRDVLIQIWVPIKKGLKSFLTTVRQPHFCHPTSERLRFYRDVSEKYEFLADEDSKQAFGLPGRVFLGKAPEWTPNVRFFRDEEYGRINYAHIYDVRGSIALPVFERGSGDCLGVVEVIMTTENFNYRPEVETVCTALQSVDLRSSKILNTRQEKVGKGSHEAVLLEILNVLRIVSDAHNLPLAQTWAPCSQQGKENGCWHSDKNALCVSMVDSACYIRDHRVLDFNWACSEHHLLRGRGGIVGKAFDTNQPCFVTDVTEFSKVDYPLSHHAKMFGLRAAIAIRLCSIYHESRDYVLEFYLPSDNLQERGLTFHGRIWESVSTVIQQHCRNLHFIRVREVEEQNLFPEKLMEEKEMEMEPLTSEKRQQEETSWFSCTMNPKKKGKEMDVSLEFGEEEPRKEHNETHCSKPELQLGQLYSDCRNIKQDSRSKGVVEDICGSSSGGQLPVSSRKTGEKRKTKAQKTISLEVLRQYFAGSLKDAARSMGVCPTTLKRICRQHGINRWPSRKIKKVGHSLKKLQVVIDSVQGSEGAINISSFYRDFPDLNSPNTQSRAKQITSMNLNNRPRQQQTKPIGSFLDSTSNSSNSSSSSQTSSHCFSGVAKLRPCITTAEDPGGSLKRARSEAELQELSKKEPNKLLERSQSHKYLAEHPYPENPPSLPMSRTWPLRDAGVLFRAKATFGEEKVCFTISPSMGFQELQHKIAKRFNLEELSKINVKYLDEDSEWVLLTCDADLEECMYIYRSSGSHTIRLALSTISSTGGSVGSSGLC